MEGRLPRVYIKNNCKQVFEKTMKKLTQSCWMSYQHMYRKSWSIRSISFETTLVGTGDNNGNVTSNRFK